MILNRWQTSKEARVAALNAGEFHIDRDSEQSHGPVGWWPLGVYGGNSADRDYSEFGNHGIRINGPSRSLQNIPNWGNIPALSLDGVNDYVDLGSATPWENDNVGTISLWFKATTLPADQTVMKLLGFGNGTGDSLSSVGIRTLSSVFTGTRFNATHVGSGADDGVYGSTTLQTDRWYHAAATSDGSAYSLFLDGKPEIVAAWQGTNSGDWFADAPKTGTFGTSIGAVNFGGIGFLLDGLISDVRIYNRALTPSEIRQQYEEPWRLVSPIGRRMVSTFGSGTPVRWRKYEQQRRNRRTMRPVF